LRFRGSAARSKRSAVGGALLGRLHPDTRASHQRTAIAHNPGLAPNGLVVLFLVFRRFFGKLALTSNMVLLTEELDELDLQLLDALQRNARSTFTELGMVVGLKAPAVHDRVKRLEQRGYIGGYSAQLDAERLGLHLVAFVSCYTSPDCAYDEFTRRLSEMPEICEVHSVAGEETFLCKVVTRSTQHLDELLARLKATPGMARTRTTIVLSTPFDRGGITVGSR